MTEQNQQPLDAENQPTSNPSKNHQFTPSENDKSHSENPSEIHSDKITNLLEKLIGVPASQVFKRWLNNNKNNIIVSNFILIVVATYGGVNVLTPPPPKNYLEQKIEETDLQVLCGNPDIFKPKLQEKGYSDTEYKILDEGAVLLEGEQVQDIYPVFRWVCGYTLTPKNPPPDNEPTQGGEGFTIHMKTGINMDKDFCQRKFGQMNLNKATYHNHNDPYSWHCTNIEFNLN